MPPGDIVTTATGAAAAVALLIAGITKLWAAHQKQDDRKDVQIDALLAADAVKTAALAKFADAAADSNIVIAKLTEQVRRVMRTGSKS